MITVGIIVIIAIFIIECVLLNNGYINTRSSKKRVEKEKAKVEVKVEYVNPYEDIIKELDQIDLYQLTPMQAMNVMYELKVKMNHRK